MKKSTQLLWSLIFIAAAAAVVFGIGYTTFRVPPESVGIVVTKTGGVKDKPVVPGGFSWNWEFLLPTNAKLVIYSSKSFSKSMELKGELPMGSVYSKLLKENPDFSYSAVLNVTLKASDSKILELYKTSKISDAADFERWYSEKSYQILNDSLTELFNEASEGTQLTVNFEMFSQKIKEKYTKDGLEVVSFGLTDTKLPDLELYRYCKTAYSKYNQIVDSKLQELASTQAQEIAVNNRNLRKLEAFANVLKEHPELSDFLKNSKDMNETLKAISSFN